MSLRFEQPCLIHNTDGTYRITGRVKVFKDPSQLYTVDENGYSFTVTKDQLVTPIHTLIYNNLKSQYPGSRDVL